jgi:hypothetical protein
MISRERPRWVQIVDLQPSQIAISGSRFERDVRSFSIWRSLGKSEKPVKSKR